MRHLRWNWVLRAARLAACSALIACLAACDSKTPSKSDTGAPKPTQAAGDSILGSFHLTPPEVVDVEVTPLQSSADGNALLSVRYAEDKRLTPSIDLTIDDKRVGLVRDANDPQRYTAKIDFDFGTFTQEQVDRKEKAAGLTELPVFKGRQQVGKQNVEFFDPVVLRRVFSERVAIKFRPGVITWLPNQVDPPRELMVTDLSVVNDPARTFDACSGTGNANGAWTFNTLMSNMANQGATGTNPADFVESWLQSWNTDVTVNSFLIPRRQNIGAQVMNSWPRTPDGKLDMTKSPMRLLAIVNRLDLRDNAIYGGGNAGEGRFVFGVLNRANGGCSALPFTVILEYGVPIKGCTAIRNYAKQWMNLGSIALSDATFNPALQAITDQFTAAGVAQSKPNGSAINQIRTNEIALAAPWELREFNVGAGHQLHLVSAKQTPHNSLNNTATLANYINANATAIEGDAHTIPLTFPTTEPFLTGSALNQNTDPAQAWNAPGVATNARHHLSLNTCNACHGSEVHDFNFLHITNRSAGAATQLSKFLVGNGTLAAPSTFDVPDPFDSATTRSFGDIVRRQGDLASLSGSCKASGLIAELMFRPLKMTH